MCLLEQRQKSIEEWVGRARGLLYSHGDSNKCESRRVVCPYIIVQHYPCRFKSWYSPLYYPLFVIVAHLVPQLHCALCRCRPLLLSLPRKVVDSSGVL